MFIALACVADRAISLRYASQQRFSPRINLPCSIPASYDGSYENPDLTLGTYHDRFCLAPGQHTGAGKSLHGQIQNSVRGEGYRHPLESFLYTHGADPEAVGFYKMMQSGEAGEKITKIELVDLTPEDAKKAATPMDSPTGGKACLTLKPVKKLVITIEKKDANGSSSSKSTNFIAEKDGKFVIPVPGPCK
jgi:hypothetical protein